MTRPKRPTRSKAAGKEAGGGGRWERIAWHEANETGYEVELQLRELGVKVRDRRWEERDGSRILSVSVSRGQMSWAQEIAFVMAKRAPAMPLEHLTPDVRRRMAIKADYVPKQRFAKRAVRSGGGPVNRLSEIVLDVMGVVFGDGGSILSSVRDRRRKYNVDIE